MYGSRSQARLFEDIETKAAISTTGKEGENEVKHDSIGVVVFSRAVRCT